MCGQDRIITENGFASISAHLPCVAFRWELGRFVWVAESASAILGISAEDLLDDPDGFFRRIRPAETARRLNDALLAGGVVEFDLQLQLDDGSAPVPFILSAAPIQEDGCPPALAGLLFGNAAKAAAQTELSQSEGRFRKAFQASPGLFAISDPETGEHIDVNDCWLETMGWRRAEVIGRTASELGVWADPADRDAIVAALEENQSVRDFSTRFRTRTGEERDFFVAGEVIEMDGLRRLLLVAHDVTERNQALRELALLNAQLEGRVVERTAALTAEIARREGVESRLTAIMEGVADAVIAADPSGTILLWNGAARAMFGWTAEEAIGMNITALMPRVYAERHAGFLDRYMSERKSAILGIGRELPALRRNGQTFPCELSLSHLNIRDEVVFIAVLRDITERKKIETALIAAKDEAQVANQAKTAFLSSMSHELRTPMNAILGFAQLLELAAQDPLTPRQRDYVEVILSAGKHLLALINDVLDLSQIEDGRITLSLEPVGIRDALKSVQDVLQPLATRFKVTLPPIEVDHAGLLWADRTRLGQVLLNLASNAIKYNNAGGSVSLIAVPGSKGEGWIRLIVADTGPGIPPDRMNELFQPFNRLGAEEGTVEGTGIGLSIARQLTEMMGGEIGVDSVFGEGTTFWVEFPAAQTEEHRTTVMASLDDGGRSARDILSEDPVTILCVEDNPASMRLIASVLSRFPKCHLVTAINGSAALTQVVRHQPDLVVTDLHLSGMDGFEILHRLRAGASTGTIPVVALTARASPREIERGLRAGFDAYLTKPLDIDRFLSVINMALANRQANVLSQA